MFQETTSRGENQMRVDIGIDIWRNQVLMAYKYLVGGCDFQENIFINKSGKIIVSYTTTVLYELNTVEL